MLALDSRLLPLDSSSCGDRNRTCVTTVNSRLPVPARTPPHQSQESRANRDMHSLRLCGSRLSTFNSRLYSVSVVGFEPTVSCARGTRKLQAFPHADVRSTRNDVDCGPNDPRERKSTQRELNPHLRPGETVRCRYVMGAFFPRRNLGVFGCAFVTPATPSSFAVISRWPNCQRSNRASRERLPDGNHS